MSLAAHLFSYQKKGEQGLFELTVTADFSAAHCLPHYPGKCRRLHGHNWRVDVTVAGGALDENGMLVDFHVLKDAVREVMATLDHYYLNELPSFIPINPTAENIAIYVAQQLMTCDNLPWQRIKLTCVRVWESSQSVAAYRPEG